MPNTTNFNWPTPADTDLVKDGAAAIRNLGDGVDTSLVDLKGGTTGQILSKASNADMDFAFITPNVGDLTEVQAGTGISVADGTGPIPIVTNSMATEIDAKGDLVVGTGADTFARLAVGTDGHTLVADSVETTGLKWVAPAAGGGLTLINTGGTSLTGASVTVSSIPLTYKSLFVYLHGVYNATSGGAVYMRLNGDTASNNSQTIIRCINTTVVGISQAAGFFEIISRTANSSTSAKLAHSMIDIQNYTTSGTVDISYQTYGHDNTNPMSSTCSGIYTASAGITSINFYGDYNFSGGTVYVYGVN
jgi:hypothetical protein